MTLELMLMDYGKRLTPAELRSVIQRAYGMTFQEMQDASGRTRERCRQLCCAGHKKIRRAMEMYEKTE